MIAILGEQRHQAATGQARQNLENGRHIVLRVPRDGVAGVIENFSSANPHERLKRCSPNGGTRRAIASP